MEMNQQDNVRSSLVPHAMIIIQQEMQTYMYMYLHNKRLTILFITSSNLFYDSTLDYTMHVRDKRVCRPYSSVLVFFLWFD